MSDKLCSNCGKLLETDDIVRFEGLGLYQALKAKTTFALQQPLMNAENLRHRSCQLPQGDNLND